MATDVAVAAGCRAAVTTQACEKVDRSAMKEPEGIGGWNPLKYASAELGEKIIRFFADRIGRRAIDVLAGRAEPPRAPDKFWMDNPGPTD